MRYLILLLLSILIFCESAIAQNEARYRGKVVEKATQLPVQGATVAIVTGKQTKIVGATDVEGHITALIPKDAELLITGVGYNDKKVKAVYDTLQIIELDEKQVSEEIVVVQGFKKVSRDRNVGTTTVITAEQIAGQPASSPEALLQGKVAGLNIQNISGAPGVRSNINLRGISSVNIQGTNADAQLKPTSPLFVVDGVPIDMNTNFEYAGGVGGPGSNPLSVIPVEDIEQFEVLRDASSTALWGSRGAYGVIIITTKRGKSLTPSFNLDVKGFYSATPRLRDVIGGRGERDIRLNQLFSYDTSLNNTEALRRINNSPYYSDSLNSFFNNSVNWQDIFFQPQMNYSVNFGVRGGLDSFNYKINLNYFNQKGILQNTGYSRYSLNTMLTYKYRSFDVQFNLNSGVGMQQQGSGTNISQRGIANATSASTLLPPPSSFSVNTSAVQGLLVNNDNKNITVYPNLSLTWQPIKKLVLSSRTSYSWNSTSGDVFSPTIVNGGVVNYTTFSDQSTTLNLNNNISYLFELGDKYNGKASHNISVFGFSEIIKSVFRKEQYELRGGSNDNLYLPVSYNFNNTFGGTVDNLFDYRQIGFGGSISYDFRTKYVLLFQYRAQNGTTNGPGTGYTKVPNFGLRWNVSREKFMENLKWISYLSVKGSYGSTTVPVGNIFDVYGRYNFSNLTYVGRPTVASDFGSIPNNNFQPIITKEYNLSMESNFFNRVSLDYNFYYRAVDNDIADLGLANTSGFSSIKVNERALVNYGHEVNINLNSKSNPDGFRWNVNINGAWNQSVLTRLEGGQRQFITYVKENDVNYPIIIKVGKNPISTLAYHTLGVYPDNKSVAIDPVTGFPVRVNGVPLSGGDPHWADINGDYIIDDVNDAVPLYDPLFKWTGGINPSFSYKNVGINFGFSFFLFRDVLNNALADKFRALYNPDVDYTKSGAIVPIDNYDYWKTPGDNARYPNPFNYQTNGSIDPYRYLQSLFVEDGSYWKCNQITANYNLPKNTLQKLNLRTARLYFTLSNPFVISNYSGVNPENVSSLGFDNSSGYPISRNFTLGAFIEF